MDAGRLGGSRRDSCNTLLMIVLTRSELLRMMSVSLRHQAARLGLSASSCPAWLMAPTGFRDFMRDAGR